MGQLQVIDFWKYQFFITYGTRRNWYKLIFYFLSNLSFNINRQKKVVERWLKFSSSGLRTKTFQGLFVNIEQNCVRDRIKIILVSYNMAH